jgi:hypothetical protein
LISPQACFRGILTRDKFQSISDDSMWSIRLRRI